MIQIFCPFCGHDTGDFTYEGDVRCIECLNCGNEFTVETNNLIPIESIKAKSYFEDDFIEL